MFEVLQSIRKTLWSTLHGSNTSRRRKSIRRQVSEALECRVLPAVVAVTLTNPAGQSNVTIVGSNSADQINFYPSNNASAVVVSSHNGTRFSVNGAASVASFEFRPLNQILLRLGAGSDRANFATSLPQIVVEDGVAATETNQYLVNSSSGPMVLGGLRATIDLGNVEFFINGPQRIDTGDMAFNFLRTARTRIDVHSKATSELNVNGGISVNSMGPASIDQVTITGFRNEKFDIAFEPNLKINGSFIANLGGGSDYLGISGTCALNGTVTIDTGAGDDSIYLGDDRLTGVNVSPTFRAAVNIGTGAGSDSFWVLSSPGQNRIKFYSTLVVNLGSDRDGATVSLAEFRSDFFINFGTGATGPNAPAESARLDKSEFFGPTQVTINGLGNVEITGQGLLPARFRNAATFVLGASSTIRIGQGDPLSRVVFHSYVWVYGLYPARPVNAFFRGFIGNPGYSKILTNVVEG